MTNDQPISRIVERLFSECLPPSFKPFVDRDLAGKILRSEIEAEFKHGYREGLAQGIFDGKMDRLRAEHAEAELSRVRGLLQRLRHEYLHAVECVDLSCDRCDQSAGDILRMAEPSAETGGEKAALKVRFISELEVDDCKTLRDYLKLYDFDGCTDSIDALEVATLAEYWYETVIPRRAESSLSSPPPQLVGIGQCPKCFHTHHIGTCQHPAANTTCDCLLAAQPSGDSTQPAARCDCICHGDNPSRVLLAAKCCVCKL